jgi:hypothetical protein
MSDINEDTLMKALENETNASVMKTSHSEIKKKKNDILQTLQLKGSSLKKMHATLIGYKYIDNIRDICVGRYVRWISLKRPDLSITLTNGAHVCNINIDYIPVVDHSDDVGCEDEESSEEELECKTCIRCKVVRNGKVIFFNLNFEENIFFQKITEQEWVILDALEYLK